MATAWHASFLGGGFADAQAHSHQLKNAVPIFEVTGRIQMARTWKIDVDDFLNRSRSRGHDQNAIRNLHRLFDVVRDEQARFLFALPDPHEIGAHFEASERFSRAER